MQPEYSPDQILATALDGQPIERRADEPADLAVRTRDGRRIVFQVKWAGEGWPQDVRRAAGQVEDPWPANVVLIARRLSPGAIAWLRERRANWADAAGQAHILGPDGLIVIREPAAIRPDDRERPFKWSRSATAIAETILARNDGPLRATDLADESGWSVPQVADVLASFDAQSWTAKHGPARGPGAHRRLLDADAMLSSWSDAVATAPRRTRVAHRAMRDTMSLLRDVLGPALDRATDWAASGWAGLELAAPFTTTVPSLHLYVADRDFAGPLSDVIESAGLREIDEGGRVTFWATASRALELAERRADGLPVVSPPRLFADLEAFGARGGDAADHVKTVLIDPLRSTATDGAAPDA